MPALLRRLRGQLLLRQAPGAIPVALVINWLGRWPGAETLWAGGFLVPQTLREALGVSGQGDTVATRARQEHRCERECHPGDCGLPCPECHALCHRC